MKVVISLGGSLVYTDGIDLKFLEKFNNFISKFNGQIAITVGGGKIAREYIEKGTILGANNFELDEIAIELVKANTRLVSASVDNSLFFNDFDEAKNYFETRDKIVFLGAGTPGQTSDSISCLLAEQVEADRWINMTNIDGIYDKDPRKFKKARKLSQISHEKLLSFVEKNDQRKSGENFIIDTLAAKILARSKIEAHFVKGNNFKEVEKAIKGLPHNGTVVK